MPSHWTPYENRRLRDLVPICTIDQIARQLGRPPGGVEARAQKLGIRATRDVMVVVGRRRRRK